MQGAAPGVKTRICFCHRMNDDGIGGKAIKPFGEAQRIVAAIGEYGVGHLAPGVHTGIGAASSVEPYRSTV